MTTYADTARAWPSAPQRWQQSWSPAHGPAGWGTGWGAGEGVKKSTLPTFAVTLYLLIHIALGPALKASSALATGHALLTLGMGLVWLTSRTPFKVILVIAYISGSEILWRGAKASIFWEYGKYSVTVLGGLALLRYYLLPKAQKLPLIYFALLLPALGALPHLDRSQISFNLSGPLALGVLTALFSTQLFDLKQFKLICLAVIGPALSMVAVATSSTLTTEGLEFFGNSNRIASGGVGPNQVSSTLSLAALMALIYLFLDHRERFLRLLITACGLWLAAQSALTFSRGGLATTFGALAVGIVLLLRDKQSRNAVVLRGILIALIAIYLMYPALNAFTGGALAKRFSDPSLTGREKLIKADLEAFAENPLFGVGPGQAKVYHARTIGPKATHTEYSRLLAEHGTLGLIALVLIGVMVMRRLRRNSSLLSVALSMTFTTWALLFLVHAAMRLAAPSVVFALGAAWILPAGSNAIERRGSSRSLPAGYYGGARTAQGWPIQGGPAQDWQAQDWQAQDWQAQDWQAQRQYYRTNPGEARPMGASKTHSETGSETGSENGSANSDPDPAAQHGLEGGHVEGDSTERDSTEGDSTEGDAS